MNSSERKYIIINKNTAGGSYKWQLDIGKFIPLEMVSTYHQLSEILSDDENSGAITVLINSFLFTDFTIENFLILHEKYKFKIIIPIHEWYWFNPGNSYDMRHHNIYLSDEMTLTDNSRLLFNACTKIICPTHFVYNILKKYYSDKKVIVCDWPDYDLNQKSDKIKLIKDKTINIGVLISISECKGFEQIKYLYEKYQNVKIYIVGVNIEKYEDNYKDFMNLIIKYNIQGLMYLNKWGETWCYGLTKGLLSGLPIFYNNIGSFKERIAKDQPKYIINNQNESEFCNLKMLVNNFNKFLRYIGNNDIVINTMPVCVFGKPLIIDEIKMDKKPSEKGLLVETNKNC
jgi:hypothetical protein